MIKYDHAVDSQLKRRSLHVLALFIVLAVAAFMSFKADLDTGVVHARSHADLRAVVVQGDRWLAAGVIGPQRDESILLMYGTADGHATTRVLERPAGEYVRGLAEIAPGRVVLVGGTSVPGSEGPLGHPLYRGLWLEIDEKYAVRRQAILGAQGATGLYGVVRSADQLVAGGVTEFRAWILARRVDGEPLWDVTWPDVSQVIALAAGGDDRVAVLAAIGPSNGPSTPLIRVIDAGGKPLWSWRGRDGVDQSLVTIAADSRGGFVAAGDIADQPVIVALGEDGKERWQRELGRDVTARIMSVTVAPSGDILCAGRSLHRDGRRHLWVQTFSAEGIPLNEASALDLEEGEVKASAPLEDGWLVVGARQTLPSPLRACIWRLDPNGNVLWSVDAQPPTDDSD